MDYNIGGFVGEAVDTIQGLGIFENISSGVIVTGLIVLAVVIFTRPIKKLLKFVFNTGLGYLALWFVNLIGANIIGVTVEVNLLNAVIVAILGIPGVAVLYFIKWMALI